jgi:hypothetical protein
MVTVGWRTDASHGRLSVPVDGRFTRAEHANPLNGCFSDVMAAADFVAQSVKAAALLSPNPIESES